MDIPVWRSVAIALLVAPMAAAQPARIDRPDDFAPTPVYLTRPVQGQVEVTNLPLVQDVRLTGGTIEGPVEVRGDVGLNVQGALPVEVVNPVAFPQQLEVTGTVGVDDSRPLSVWVENVPQPQAQSPQRRFTAFGVRGAFSSKEATVKKKFRPAEGEVFHLTDLAVDTRPDAVLKVRVVASPLSIAGQVAGVATGEMPLLVLDGRLATAGRLGTPVPLAGEFTVEVEALGPGQGAPFWVVASGYVSREP